MNPSDELSSKVQTLLHTGRQQAALGDFIAAQASLEHASQLAPASFEAWFLLGIVHMRHGRYATALAPLSHAHRLQPDHMDATRALADATFHAGAPADALPLWLAVVASRPLDIDARLKLGETHNRLGQLDAEIACYTQGLTMQPEAYELHMALAQTHEDAGRREEALRCYEQALTLNPDWAIALTGLLSLEQSTAPDDRISQAITLMLKPSTSDRDRALLGYALGKVFDKRNQPDSAMTHWHQANAARRRMCGSYNQAAADVGVQCLIETFDASFFARDGSSFGSQDSRPVFVVGMPRSGTTLVEQILASHPDAHGAGELPEIPALVNALGADWPSSAAMLGKDYLLQAANVYLEAAAWNAPPGVRRLIDKAPLNFYNLGLIARLFPNAKVIWCRRDPRDITLSTYGENFALEALFATELTAIAHTIELHTQLMRHWQQVLPLPILELHYERLVTAPTDESHRLMEFLGLPWDPACLQFHHSGRTVRTPSRWQVREPIHARSTGRWQRYAEHLPAFGMDDFPEDASS